MDARGNLISERITRKYIKPSKQMRNFLKKNLIFFILKNNKGGIFIFTMSENYFNLNSKRSIHNVYSKEVFLTKNIFEYNILEKANSFILDITDFFHDKVVSKKFFLGENQEDLIEAVNQLHFNILISIAKGFENVLSLINSRSYDNALALMRKILESINYMYYLLLKGSTENDFLKNNPSFVLEEKLKISQETILEFLSNELQGLENNKEYSIDFFVKSLNKYFLDITNQKELSPDEIRECLKSQFKNNTKRLAGLSKNIFDKGRYGDLCKNVHVSVLSLKNYYSLENYIEKDIFEKTYNVFLELFSYFFDFSFKWFNLNQADYNLTTRITCFLDTIVLEHKCPKSEDVTEANHQIEMFIKENKMNKEFLNIIHLNKKIEDYFNPNNQNFYNISSEDFLKFYNDFYKKKKKWNNYLKKCSDCLLFINADFFNYISANYLNIESYIKNIYPPCYSKEKDTYLLSLIKEEIDILEFYTEYINFEKELKNIFNNSISEDKLSDRLNTLFFVNKSILEFKELPELQIEEINSFFRKILK